jgi:hypothetical protein
LENAIDLAAKDYTDRTKQMTNPEQLIKLDDLISTVKIGSKKNPDTWTKAKEKYDGALTITVYEDTYANLKAALQGLKACFGYHITSTKNGLARLVDRCNGPEIFRGHMEECLPDMKNRAEIQLHGP